MKTIQHERWQRSGFSVLWEPRALAGIIEPAGVISMRELFALSNAWPDELPGSKGKALVVAGLDGCLDVLSDSDATVWLESDLREVLRSFQQHFQRQAALILWLASGRTRVEMSLADERYIWKVTGGSTLEFGRCLWGGSERDVERILISPEKNPDPNGAAWVGLHHQWIS